MDVLIADSDHNFRALLKSVLYQNGYTVIEADTGKKAWQLYLAKKPPIVIADFFMLEMDGISLCRNIRELSNDRYTYIMVLTAEDESHDFRQEFDAGADDYIGKPLNTDELTARIKSGKRIMEYKAQLYGMQSELETKNRYLQRALDKMETVQTRMLEAEEMAAIGRLSAGLAHEINNPIGFVDGNLKVLSGYVDDLAKMLSLYQRLIQTVNSQGIRDGKIEKQLAAMIKKQANFEIDYLTEQVPRILQRLAERVGTISSVIKKFKYIAIPLSAIEISMENKGNGI